MYYLNFIITVDPQGSFDNQSEDYEEISSKLDSQICEQASIDKEEKVCCKKDDPVRNYSNSNLTSKSFYHFSWKSTVAPGLVSTPQEEVTPGWLD